MQVLLIVLAVWFGLYILTHLYPSDKLRGKLSYVANSPIWEVIMFYVNWGFLCAVCYALFEWL